MSWSAKRTKSLFIRRRMQACRNRLGLTCEEVAKRAFIVRDYYVKIENGQCTPSRATMMAIAEVLQCKKWYLLYELQAVTDNLGMPNKCAVRKEINIDDCEGVYWNIEDYM